MPPLPNLFKFPLLVGSKARLIPFIALLSSTTLMWVLSPFFCSQAASSAVTPIFKSPQCLTASIAPYHPFLAPAYVPFSFHWVLLPDLCNNHLHNMQHLLVNHVLPDVHINLPFNKTAAIRLWVNDQPTSHTLKKILAWSGWLRIQRYHFLFQTPTSLPYLTVASIPKLPHFPTTLTI